MKVCIQRTTLRVIEDQVITLASPFVPQQLVQTIPPVFNYIQKKKCGILAHPRKVLKTIPSMAVGNLISSDFLSNTIDNIDDQNIHDLAQAVVVFVKYAMMTL